MLWLKICGVRDLATAVFAAENGASAIGLNRWQKSPRYVAVDELTWLRKFKSRFPACQTVALYVNAKLEQILADNEHITCNFVQLHGDAHVENLDYQKKLHKNSIGIINAMRLSEELINKLRPKSGNISARAVANYISKQFAFANKIIIDAHLPEKYGGGGKRVNWDLARQITQAAPEPQKFIIAGGLTPTNVAEALAKSTCAGADVSSGVESALGRKSLAKVRDFLVNARAIDAKKS